MICRLRHTGRVQRNLSVSDFTLVAGFTSPDFDLVDGSPDALVVEEWIDEGLIEKLPPLSAGKVEAVSRVGGRSKGKTMTAEEVKEYMSPANKRRRRSTVLSRTERNMATHKPPIGMPFGPRKGTRIFTAEDLAEGKPAAPPPPPPPEGNELQDRSKERKVYTSDEVPPTGLAIRPEDTKGKELSSDDVKKMNKNVKDTGEVTSKEAPAESAPEETAKKADEATVEKSAEEDMGKPPVDNVILDIFVEKLDEMTKKEISSIAKGAKIELPNQINKAPLVALVAEELVKKGYTELPS